MSAPLATALLEALDEDALEALADRLAPRLAKRLRTDTGEDRWMTSAQAAAYLGMTPNALHKLTAARTIPFSQDGPGCRCYFRRSDLDRWRDGRRRGPP